MGLLGIGDEVRGPGRTVPGPSMWLCSRWFSELREQPRTRREQQHEMKLQGLHPQQYAGHTERDSLVLQEVPTAMRDQGDCMIPIF